MTPSDFATQACRLNEALAAGDTAEAEAAVYAMDLVVPETAGRMWASVARAARKMGVVAIADEYLQTRQFATAQDMWGTP